MVYPTKIEIYETYNPGSVVRILAADCDPDDLSTDSVRFVCMMITSFSGLQPQT